MTHQSHPRVTWPALLVLIPDNVFEIRVRVLGQETLNQIARLIGGEPEEDPDTINVPGVQSDRVADLGVLVLELQEIVRAFWCTSNLVCTLQT